MQVEVVVHEAQGAWSRSPSGRVPSHRMRRERALLGVKREARPEAGLGLAGSGRSRAAPSGDRSADPRSPATPGDGVEVSGGPPHVNCP
jgi:hypothetical protein